MQQSGAPREPGERGYAAWFGFWGQLVVFGLLAVVGAFFASEDAAPGDYACGLILSIASIALAFLRIKYFFDGGDLDWTGFLLVENVANLLAVVTVFALLALIGLFVAARFDHGGLHNAGVALFVASGIGVFLSLKHVFDNLDRPR